MSRSQENPMGMVQILLEWLMKWVWAREAGPSCLMKHAWHLAIERDWLCRMQRRILCGVEQSFAYAI
jgi:hypothetical protein